MYESALVLNNYLLENFQKTCRIQQPNPSLNSPHAVICKLKDNADIINIIRKFLEPLKRDFKYVYINKSDMTGYVTTFNAAKCIRIDDGVRLQMTDIYGHYTNQLRLDLVTECEITSAHVSDVSFRLKFKENTTFLNFTNNYKDEVSMYVMSLT